MNTEDKQPAKMGEVRIATGVEADPVTGLNRSTTSFTMPVLIDPDLEAPGKVDRPLYGDCAIVLREPNDQVLLHEVLHALLDGSVPHDDLDPFGHRTISRVEVTLWEMGWRRQRRETDIAEPSPDYVQCVCGHDREGHDVDGCFPACGCSRPGSASADVRATVDRWDTLGLCHDCGSFRATHCNVDGLSYCDQHYPGGLR